MTRSSRRHEGNSMHGQGDTTHDAATYGDEWAIDYDELDDPGDEHTLATVACLVELAAGRPVLEVAAGTGRVAIPLARAGLEVTATDASSSMLAVLAAKPGGDRVTAKVDVMPAITTGERYGLVCNLLFSIYAMTAAADQRLWLRHAGEALLPGGLVVVEMGPPQARTPTGSRDLTYSNGVRGEHTWTFDPITHVMEHAYVIHLPDTSARPRRRTTRTRPLTPTELLLMAELEGLQVAHLWGGWDRRPWGPTDDLFIAVLEAR